MSWQFTDSAEAFRDNAGEFLAADAQRHTVALTVLDNALRGLSMADEPMHFGWYDDGAGHVSGAIMLTPAYPMLLADVASSTIPQLIAGLRERNAPVIGVNADVESAREFAAAWLGPDCASPRIQMEERLYQLEHLVPPDPAPAGKARAATMLDVDVVHDWFVAFHLEAHAGTPVRPMREVLEHRLSRGLIWLWQAAGRVVSLAGRSEICAGISRVGPVYTPPVFRRHGYGAAVTAACTSDALAGGADGVVLFTDLSNPTSNAIYQAIGYRPVADRLVLDLE